MAGLELTYHDEACAAALSDESLLAAMVRFEAALARASASAGVIEASQAEAIARACESVRFDARALGLEARSAGTLVVPFLARVRARVAAESPQAAECLHRGATTQDVVDTALALCVRPAAERILALSGALGDAAAQLARRHASTPCMARTLLQPALPVTFGWKAAVWLSTLARSHAAFKRASADMQVLQFGGPEGTLATLGAHALAVESSLAAALQLRVAPAPWHSARDLVARLGCEAAILSGAAGKVARDVSLLTQPEIGEIAEPAAPGRGGSSSMPHKRNPAGSLLALEAALRAPGLAATLLAQLTPELDRGLGQWQSQWLTLRDLLASTASGLSAMREVLEGLEVDAAAMHAHLQRAGAGEAKTPAGARMIERVLEEWQRLR